MDRVYRLDRPILDHANGVDQSNLVLSIRVGTDRPMVEIGINHTSREYLFKTLCTNWTTEVGCDLHSQLPFDPSTNPDAVLHAIRFKIFSTLKSYTVRYKFPIHHTFVKTESNLYTGRRETPFFDRKYRFLEPLTFSDLHDVRILHLISWKLWSCRFKITCA